MIERHQCVRKNLMSFSTAGKKHSHAVVRALYNELLRRIEKREISLAPKRSIIESVMPKREAWRGVGGEDDRSELLKYYTMLCTFTAWRWVMSKNAKPVTTSKKKKRFELTNDHDVCSHLINQMTCVVCVEDGRGQSLMSKTVLS